MSRQDKSDTDAFETERIDDEATDWVVKSQRGLSAQETRQLEAWLAQDKRHADRYYHFSRTWSDLTNLQDRYRNVEGEADPDLLTRGRSKPPLSWLRSHPAVAAAAAVALLVFGWMFAQQTQQSESPAPPSERVYLASAFQRHFLSDGSLVEMKAGSRISVAYTESERRLRLLAGEAHFEVAKDSARPFVVAAGGAEFSAVGTAFNVQLEGDSVELLVTEGLVKLRQARVDTDSALKSGSAAASAGSALVEEVLGAKQRAVVRSSVADAMVEPIIDEVSEELVAERMSWRAPEALLFESAPLSEVVDAFNQRNFRQIRLASPELADMKIEARFRSDNVDGLIKMLSITADVDAREEDYGRVIVLSGHP